MPKAIAKSTSFLSDVRRNVFVATNEASPKKTVPSLRDVPVMSKKRQELFAGFENSNQYSTESVYAAFAANRQKRLG